MQIPANVFEGKRKAFKSIVVLALLFVVGSVAIQYLRNGGVITPGMGGQTEGVSMRSTEPYAADVSGKMAIDPIAPMPPMPVEPVPGTNAESYEVTDYSVSIETGNRERDCQIVQALKGREDVIFDNASDSKYGCTVSFKVKRDSVPAILSYLKELNPRDINENTYTIKREVSQYEDQITILEKKLTTLTTALDEALKNFAEVEALARRSGDVAALAQAIESKVTTIDRITASRVEVVAQLDQLSMAKADALDRMNFVHFSVTVYENSWVRDGEFKDSWVTAFQELIRSLNTFVQDLSIGFVEFMLLVVKYLAYATILYVLARPLARRVQQAWGKW